MGDHGSDAAGSRGVPIGLAGVAFVADDGAGLNVGPDVEQGFEVTPVEGFAAGQVEGDDVAGGVRFCVDFRGEAPVCQPSGTFRRSASRRLRRRVFACGIFPTGPTNPTKFPAPRTTRADDTPPLPPIRLLFLMRVKPRR